MTFDDALRKMLEGAYFAKAKLLNFTLMDAAARFLATRAVDNIRDNKGSEAERLRDALNAISTMDGFLIRLFRANGNQPLYAERATQQALPTRDCVYPHCTNVR